MRSPCYCGKRHCTRIPHRLWRRSGNTFLGNFTLYSTPLINWFITQNGLQKVDLKVLLPTHEVVSVTVCKTSTTLDVYNATVEKICLDKQSVQYFALFEIVEYNFGKTMSLLLFSAFHSHMFYDKQSVSCRCTRCLTTFTSRITARRRPRVSLWDDGSSRLRWSCYWPVTISSRLICSGKRSMKLIAVMLWRARISTNLKPCRTLIVAPRYFNRYGQMDLEMKCFFLIVSI